MSLKASGITLKKCSSTNVACKPVWCSHCQCCWQAWYLPSCLMRSVCPGLALASGFGWYSLSAIVMTDAYGAVWGSVALFNDLLREFVALACIPLSHATLSVVSSWAWRGNQFGFYLTRHSSIGRNWGCATRHQLWFYHQHCFTCADGIVFEFGLEVFISTSHACLVKNRINGLILPT